jgi:cytochrome c biogenesis protein CcmG/thiol:disulfide interchange protein DsbE
MRRLPRLRRWLVLVGVAGTLALLAAGLAANHPTRALDTAMAAGHRPSAPTVSLPLLGRPGQLTLAGLRGQVVVLNVWASWCDPCRGEAPILERWYRRLRADRVTVVGVDTFDASSDARSFIRQLRLSYPMVRDPAGEVKNAYGVTGFPESFVIDRRGRVAALVRGPVDDNFMRSVVMPLARAA